MDGVAVAHGVVEPAQRHEAAALRWHQPVGVAVERSGPSAAAQRPQGCEADVDEQVVGAVHRAGEHQVGRAVVQPIAGERDGVQAAGTCGVEGEGAGAQAQRSLQHQRRQAGGESVARVDRGVRGALEARYRGDRHRLGERGHAGRRERQVAEHGAVPGAVVVGVAGVTERLPSRVERPPEHRVEPGDLLDRDGEAAGVEQVVEAGDVAAAVGPGAVDAVIHTGTHHVVRGHLPAFRRRGGDEIDAVHDGLPQLVRGVRPGQEARPTDDRDRGELAHAGTRSATARRGSSVGAPPITTST